MKLLNYIGIILMAIGLFMGSYYAVEWYKGRSSAGQLTAEEIKSLKIYKILNFLVKHL